MQIESFKRHVYKLMRRQSFKGGLMTLMGEEWLLAALKPELIVH